MRVHLGGHLSWYDPQKRAWIELPAAAHESPADLLARLGVPASEVAVVRINRRPADLAGAAVSDSDTVEFYPPVGGG